MKNNAILFITRKYPPQTGGMESFSHGLISHYPSSKYSITLGKSQYHLLWFLPFAYFRGIWLILRHKDIQIIHLGDALLAPLGWFLKISTGRKIVTTVHGLDLIYPNLIYQKCVLPFLPKIDLIVAVSQSTKRIVLEKRLHTEVLVIPNGISLEAWRPLLPKAEARDRINDYLETNLSEKIILIGLGRPVKRKGYLWFVQNVLTKLDERFAFLLLGVDPQKNNSAECSGLIEACEKWQGPAYFKVFGRIEQDVLKFFFQGSDIFVMPNLNIANDVEGFGIVALEAAACGLNILAADVKGVRDIVGGDDLGWLLPSGNASEWFKIILYFPNKRIDSDTNKNIQKVEHKYTWTQIANQYNECFESVINKNR